MTFCQIYNAGARATEHRWRRDLSHCSVVDNVGRYDLFDSTTGREAGIMLPNGEVVRYPNLRAARVVWDALWAA